MKRWMHQANTDKNHTYIEKKPLELLATIII